jgi:hypothetical protein
MATAEAVHDGGRLVFDQRDTVTSTKPVRHSGGPRATKDHPMPTANRYAQRYGSAPARTCSTPTCNRDVPPTAITSRCSRCRHNHSRLGHELQTLPSTPELDKRIRAGEEERGSLKYLDLAALETRWTLLVDETRAKCTSSYKDKGTLSYNGHEREASQLIRDCADQITWLRAFDLITAVHLLHLEGYWRSEGAMACSLVELLRRTSRVGCRVVAMNNSNGTIERSYRRELSRPSRLAAARMLMVALGGACSAIALRKHKRADQERETRASYYDAVRAIEADATAV